MTFFLAVTIPLLLGERKLAVEAFQVELAHPDRWPPYMNRKFYKALLEYGAGTGSAKQMEDAAAHSRWDLSMAFYLIAFNKLSAGDRAGARAYLQKCLDTDNFFIDYMWWCRAFLERLKDNPPLPALAAGSVGMFSPLGGAGPCTVLRVTYPQWPHWIPLKQ
jgi:hypothetical protein